MAPNKRPNSAPRIIARSVNSLIFLSLGTNGRNSPGGAVELHGRSLKESLPDAEQGADQIGSVADYAAGGACGEENLGRGEPKNRKQWTARSLDISGAGRYCPPQYCHRSSTFVIISIFCLCALIRSPLAVNAD